MYNEYFGFREAPFSIAPDPRYLFMTEQHREALAHLVYGLNSDGGIILLTGEVGTGKTTVCRALLNRIPDKANIALVLNPKLTAVELLATICDELHIEHPADASLKTCTDLIHRFLIDRHASGEKTVLIIDEAQHLDHSVLEQLRLLTNLETDKQKLLQIIILGQPELLDILSSEDMRQLAQRITARFHLKPLNRDEIKAYVDHRLAVAGQNVQLFTPTSIQRLYSLSHGIPRLINILCDRALLGACVQNHPRVEAQTLEQAASEVFGEIKTVTRRRERRLPRWGYAVAALLLVSSTVGWLYLSRDTSPQQASPALGTAIDAGTDTATDSTTSLTTSTSMTAAMAASANTAISQAAQDSTAPTAAATTLPAAWLDTQYRDAARAWAALFRLWNRDFDPANGKACMQAAKHGLACLHKTGNLNRLRQINRPAVLKLYDSQGEAVYLTLARLDNEQATLQSGNQDFTLARETLDRHWLGEYSVLWQPPPFYQKALTPGAEGPLVQWLNQQMARLGNDDQAGIAVIRDRYQGKLIEQIKRFQRKHGLIPDGIAGPLTFIHLNNAVGRGAPVLQPLETS